MNIFRYQNPTKKSFLGLLLSNTDSYFCLPERSGSYLQNDFVPAHLTAFWSPWLRRSQQRYSEVSGKGEVHIHIWTTRLDRTCRSALGLGKKRYKKDGCIVKIWISRLLYYQIHTWKNVSSFTNDEHKQVWFWEEPSREWQLWGDKAGMVNTAL